MVTLEPYFWALWAHESREGHDVRGHQTRAAFYTPPRRMESDDKDLQMGNVAVREDDWMVARKIQRGINALRRADQRGADAVVRWWGAYPGAPERRNERIMGLGMGNRRTVQSVVEQRMAWVEGFVHGSDF